MSVEVAAAQAGDPTFQAGVLDPRDLAGLAGVDFLRGIMDGRYPAPPFSQVAAIRPVSVDEGHIVFTGVPSASFYNPMGIVHGGWIAMLLDTVMGCAVHSALPAGKAYTTVEMKTSFIRAVNETSGALTAEGTVLHLGGKIASAEGRIYDRQKRLIAHGSETCLIWTVNGGQP